MDTDLFRRHLDYNAWANNRLPVASAALAAEQRDHDFGTADKSIAGATLHVFRAERIWLARLKSQAVIWQQPPDVWTYINVEWPQLQRQWIDFVVGLRSDDLSRDSSYTDLRGNPHQTAVGDVILHLVNHGTHHRGQVSGFLRTLGSVPPPLDLILFLRQLKQKES